jgi:hypothetical protein
VEEEERRKRWKQRDKELENTVEREDMRDDGRGILNLPGGRDLRDKERRMKLNGRNERQRKRGTR